MIISRNISDLIPEVGMLCDKHVALCAHAGITLLVYCTYRDWDAQTALYKQGRTTLGRIVTNAKAGDSAHQYRRAYDCVPLSFGKPVWSQTTKIGVNLWENVGMLGESVGLEWAGRWKHFREEPHFQFLGGKTIAQYRDEYVNTHI